MHREERRVFSIVSIYSHQPTRCLIIIIIIIMNSKMFRSKVEKDKSFRSIHAHPLCTSPLSFKCNIQSCPVNHSDIQFKEIDDLSSVCHFYLCMMPFFPSPPISPPLSLSLASLWYIANYFKLSGRQLQCQLNLFSGADLGPEKKLDPSVPSRSSLSYGCHSWRN